MEFEWDPAKNDLNIVKHGIDFDDAKVSFDGPGLEKYDRRKDYGEVRKIWLGWMQDIPIYVVFTRRSGRIRMFSARMATYAEEQQLVAKVVGEKLIQQGKWMTKRIEGAKKRQSQERGQAKREREERKGK